MLTEVLPLIRKYKPTLIGSALYSATPNDIDILVAVPNEQIPAVTSSLAELGFSKNIPVRGTTDKCVHSAYSKGTVDIQIATPDNYERKRTATRLMYKLKLYKGLDKASRYKVAAKIYEVI